jgi:phage terminase large subunit-like protein
MPSGRKTAPLDSSPGPWEKWRGTYHGKTIRFIQTYCRSPKGDGFGRPIKLAGWQKEEIESMYAQDVDAAVESFPRGNGKSTIEAALGTAGVFLPHESGAPQVPIIATTVGQAIRSVYGTAASMVAHEPELASRSIAFTGMGSTRIFVPRGEGEMFPMANGEAVVQGLDPTLAIADEIGFQPMSAWGGLVQAGGKRSRSLVLGMGTPGVDQENALFLLRKQLMDGAVIPRLHYREWAADPGCTIDDRAQWRKANPAIGAGFLRESALETDLGMMPAARFRIFRLGQWVDGYTSWLGEDGRAVWDGLRDSFRLEPNAPMWIGIDVGLKHDSTAVVSVQVRDDGKLHAAARFWVPTEGTPVDVTDVMEHVRVLCSAYKVGAVAFDPRFFDVPAKMLHDEGLPLVEVPQSPERMTPIVANLYERIMTGRLTHDDDPVLAQHVLNAVPRFTERGFTLQKQKSQGRIDGVVALALAVAQADNRKPPRAPVFVGVA